MEIKYQSGLEHQQKAVDALIRTFDGLVLRSPAQTFTNPELDFVATRIGDNIKAVQSDPQYNVEPLLQRYTQPQQCLNLDIKMETGTGKTYVYAHAMYELHRRFGISKFIVAVPSLAVKEGAKSFLGDPDVTRHFSNDRGYHAEMTLCVLQARQAKKGKRWFPSEVRDFVSASSRNSNRIYVLLVNMGLLSDRKDGMLGREDYDQIIAGFYRPYDALRATRPFVIIDEPHRFERSQKAFSVIQQEIRPQCVIRFGATFPDKTEGRGKQKVTRKDYENLLYNLNAYESFNQNLVKGVAKEHFEPVSKKPEKIRISAISSRDSVTLQHITATKSHTLTLRKNESFGSISEDMAGINITAIGKDFIELSNGQIRRKGEEFDVDIYSTSYQEAMLRLALQRHFETERQNFNRVQRIKTLSLFFIEDIDSFRGDADGKSAWLRDMFTALLQERLEHELRQPDTTEEYANFLRASLHDLQACSAGYFAQDNSDSDESIAKEVDDILRNKKGLLQFKNHDGSWNVRRFLFSKWTLKEGWDNPNVFTIVKLRSSGSEISKLQEVGRGLRLPVDEYGNRIGNEQFMLNYIVDFKEADFAGKLVAEINGDRVRREKWVISDDELLRVAGLRGISADDLFDALRAKKYIDRHAVVLAEDIMEFLAEYPEFDMYGLKNVKVTDRNRKEIGTVKIRPAQYAALKELWEQISRKYIIFFNQELNERIEHEFILADDVFAVQTMTSDRSILSTKDGQALLLSEPVTSYATASRKIPYNAFLLRINKATSIPVKTIHTILIKYFQTHNFLDDMMNEHSVSRFVSQFNEWKVQNIMGQIQYKQAHYTTKETALTDASGKLRDEVVLGRLGIHFEKAVPLPKYLYDAIVYDSPLERKNIMTEIQDVIVYGKIPRRSFAIPTIDGNYSPDFMYVVRRENGKRELNIIVETKDVEGKTDLRGSETMKISCAEKFFAQLKLDGFDVRFRTQIGNREMLSIVQELMQTK